MNCSVDVHILLLAIIILAMGSFGGYLNYLHRFDVDEKEKMNKNAVWKYVLLGIGSAILVPAFLKMIASDLIKESSPYDNINYFIFSGFCLVAAIFSKRFITTISEKVLKDLEKTKAKVNENEEKIDLVISNETDTGDEAKTVADIDLTSLESDSSFKDEDPKVQMDKVIKLFGGKYKFRTDTGIAKELNYTLNIVQLLLDFLERKGMVKRFTKKDGKVIWSLTKIGQILLNKKD